MKSCRFTPSDAYACEFGSVKLTWADYARRILAQKGFDFDKPIKKVQLCDGVIYQQED